MKKIFFLILFFFPGLAEAGPGSQVLAEAIAEIITNIIPSEWKILFSIIFLVFGVYSLTYVYYKIIFSRKERTLSENLEYLIILSIPSIGIGYMTYAMIIVLPDFEYTKITEDILNILKLTTDIPSVIAEFPIYSFFVILFLIYYFRYVLLKVYMKLKWIINTLKLKYFPEKPPTMKYWHNPKKKKKKRR